MTSDNLFNISFNDTITLIIRLFIDNNSQRIIYVTKLLISTFYEYTFYNNHSFIACLFDSCSYCNY